MATVPKSDRATIITVASAIAGPFKLTFRLFDDDALAVFVNDQPREDFTITSSYVDGYDDDATITMASALAIGDVVRIHGDMVPARADDYVNGPGLTEKMNIEMARIWAAISDMKRDTNRSAKFFQNVPPIEMGAKRAVVTNSSSDGLEMGPSVSVIEAISSSAVMIPISEDETSVLVSIGTFYVVSESDTPYPSVTLEAV